jgi:hypothetical protein
LGSGDLHSDWGIVLFHAGQQEGVAHGSRLEGDQGQHTDSHPTGDESQELLETLLLGLREVARPRSPEGKEVLDAGKRDISRPLLEAQPLQLLCQFE